MLCGPLGLGVFPDEIIKSMIHMWGFRNEPVQSGYSSTQLHNILGTMRWLGDEDLLVFAHDWLLFLSGWICNRGTFLMTRQKSNWIGLASCCTGTGLEKFLSSVWRGRCLCWLNQHIIYMDLHGTTNFLFKHFVDQSLVSCPCIFKSKRDDIVTVDAHVGHERYFFLVF